MTDLRFISVFCDALRSERSHALFRANAADLNEDFESSISEMGFVAGIDRALYLVLNLLPLSDEEVQLDA